MLSIVATLYKSGLYIEEFHRRVHKVAHELVGNDYEIVLVNDGSPDNSLDLAIQLTQKNVNVVVIDLSRNFGHHKAMITGLMHAKGQRVFLIDSDLEEEPEWLVLFSKVMDQHEADVVYGVQEERKGGLLERWSGRWFYIIFNMLSGLALTENIVTARLMSRRYVNALLLHEEREIFLAGLWHITGFSQIPQSIKKQDSSKTTYTFSKKLSLLVNSVTSFSNIPLISIFYFGICISSISIIYIVYLFAHKIFFAKPLSGWTSLMSSIWLLGGMIISVIGLLGIYLAKVFSETKKRPISIVKKIYEIKHE